MAKRKKVITKPPRSTEKKRKKKIMSLKGNLDAITSYIRRSKDPVLLGQAKSLLKEIFHLIDRILEHAESIHVPKDAFEIQMLYGIQRKAQIGLARKGYDVRVLISYGTEWYPWFMRRLAERPANLWFLIRNLF